MAFVRKVSPRFHQLDPAGIVFFGEVFALASDVYEDFIRSLGFDWDDWFKNPSILCPVRHAEADYRRPLSGGHSYDVTVEILTLGSSSFEIAFVFSRNESIHCVVRLVHVFIDGVAHAKTPVPDIVRRRFTDYGVRPSPLASP